LIENFEMGIDESGDGEEFLDDGQKTPISSGTNSTSVNVAQEMLQNVLKILSPKEKMDK